MTNNLKACTINQHRLHKLSLENPAFLPEYKRYKNVLVNTFRTAKKNYYTGKFDSCLSDFKETWKVINKVLKPNSKKKIGTTLEIHGDLTSNPQTVSNKSNEYFISVASNLADKIPQTNINPLNYISRQQIVFF